MSNHSSRSVTRCTNCGFFLQIDEPVVERERSTSIYYPDPDPREANHPEPGPIPRASSIPLPPTGPVSGTSSTPPPESDPITILPSAQGLDPHPTLPENRGLNSDPDAPSVFVTTSRPLRVSDPEPDYDHAFAMPPTQPLVTSTILRHSSSLPADSELLSNPVPTLPCLWRSESDPTPMPRSPHSASGSMSDPFQYPIYEDQEASASGQHSSAWDDDTSGWDIPDLDISDWDTTASGDTSGESQHTSGDTVLGDSEPMNRKQTPNLLSRVRGLVAKKRTDSVKKKTAKKTVRIWCTLMNDKFTRQFCEVCGFFRSPSPLNKMSSCKISIPQPFVFRPWLRLQGHVTSSSGLVFWNRTRMSVLPLSGTVVLWGKTELREPPALHFYWWGSVPVLMKRRVVSLNDCDHEAVNILGLVLGDEEFLCISCPKCEVIRLYSMKSKKVSVAFHEPNFRPGYMCHGAVDSQIFVVNLDLERGLSILELHCSATEFTLKKVMPLGMRRYYGISFEPSNSQVVVSGGIVRAFSWATNEMLWHMGDCEWKVNGLICEPCGVVHCPNIGDVFVADGNNSRILELDPRTGTVKFVTEFKQNLGAIAELAWFNDCLVIRHNVKTNVKISAFLPSCWVWRHKVGK